MRLNPFAAALIGSALALSACSSSGSRPQTQVTRFHLGQPIAPGRVAVEPVNPAMGGSLEFNTYAQAVAAQLTRLNFDLAPGVTQSELVAALAITRDTREGMARRPPVTIGLGGGSFGWSGGVGGGVSFPVGKSGGRQDTITELRVQLKRRSDNTVIWEGRAQTLAPAGTPAADPAAAAAKLADALFRDFPGESGRTISVP